eukprot:20318-Amphidinium_carterae.1
MLQAYLQTPDRGETAHSVVLRGVHPCVFHCLDEPCHHCHGGKVACKTHGAHPVVLVVHGALSAVHILHSALRGKI